MSTFEERQELFDKSNSDELDRASSMEMENTRNLVLEVRQKCRPQQLPLADGTYAVEDCEDCGNEIGEGRLRVAINNLLCIHCATRRERINR